MNPDFAKYTSRQYFNNLLLNFDLELKPVIADLRKRVCAAEDQDQVDALLGDLKQKIDFCSDIQCKEDENLYYLLRAYCYLWMGKSDEAVNVTKIATSGFRMCDDPRSEWLGHWFLGLIYALQRRGNLYLGEINQAMEILANIHRAFTRKGEYGNANKCIEFMGELSTHKELATKLGTGPLYRPGQFVTFSAPASPPPETPPLVRLLIPWLPKYHAVRAGPSGLIWDEPLKENVAYAREVEIDNIVLRLHPLKGTSTLDRQITLSPHERFGWALVQGNSMNAAQPVPIHHGDYILFRIDNHPYHNQIVVASKPAGSKYAYMVKRFNAIENLLISETNDPTDDYSPVQLSSQHQILGIVIAVAKSK